MSDDDCEYYRRRALDEREFEKSACSTVSANIHALMAEMYEAMAGQGPPKLRLVSNHPVDSDDPPPETVSAAR